MSSTPIRQGRILVPADLDAVTDIGDEDHSEISRAAVERSCARRASKEIPASPPAA